MIMICLRPRAFYRRYIKARLKILLRHSMRTKSFPKRICRSLKVCLIWSDKFVRHFQNSAYIKPVRLRDNSAAFTLKAHYRKKVAGKVAILRMGYPADFYGITDIQADTEKRGEKALDSDAEPNGADRSAAAGGIQSRYGCNL